MVPTKQATLCYEVCANLTNVLVRLEYLQEKNGKQKPVADAIRMAKAALDDLNELHRLLAPGAPMPLSAPSSSHHSTNDNPSNRQ